jgi:excisionase family DNA binding protein
MEETIDKLLTVEEVMKALRISRPTLYRLLKAKALEPVRIGKRVLFDVKDLRAFIERSKGGEKQQKKEKKPKRAKPQKPRKTEKPETPPVQKKREAPRKDEDKDKQGRLL